MIYNTFPYSTGHKNWREIPYSGTHPNICWQYAPINIHIPWISHEYPMNISWISHEYPMNIPWIFHGYPHRYCLSRLRITGLSQFSGHAERRHHVPGRKCHRMEGSPADLGRCSAGARGGQWLVDLGSIFELWGSTRPGKHTKNYRKSPCWIGKLSINRPFSLAMLYVSLPEGSS